MAKDLQPIMFPLVSLTSSFGTNKSFLVSLQALRTNLLTIKNVFGFSSGRSVTSPKTVLVILIPLISLTRVVC